MDAAHVNKHRNLQSTTGNAFVPVCGDIVNKRQALARTSLAEAELKQSLHAFRNSTFSKRFWSVRCHTIHELHLVAHKKVCLGCHKYLRIRTSISLTRNHRTDVNILKVFPLAGPCSHDSLRTRQQSSITNSSKKCQLLILLSIYSKT